MASQLSFQQPHRSSMLLTVLAGVFAAAAQPALAFVSGSTGADGAFNPTVNTQLTLAPSGIFNFTTINIPAGVTVTFAKNATNTPVVMLATGDVTIAGTINLNASDGAPIGGNIADDGLPGIGGPGGFAGGRGGAPGTPPSSGGDGLGPGGGGGGYVIAGSFPSGYYGGSAGYATAGPGQASGNPGAAGAAYGSQQLLPLIGGSGGGGGAGGSSFAGSGGGGGGGAILIASSGTINVTNTSSAIVAQGAAGGQNPGASGSGFGGGCGSGGGIRLIGTAIAGNGRVFADSTSQQGGSCPFGLGSAGFIRMEAENFTYNGSANPGYSFASNCAFGQGSPGFVRMESENFTYNGNVIPTNSFAGPGPVFITGSPTVAITSVGGVAVPAAPTGVGDVQLPANTVNPVTIDFQTTGIPVGNTITLSIVPANGAGTKVTSGALTGSTSSATSSVQATLPSGPSTLLATVTYTIVASLGNELSRYAENQRVERVEVAAVLGGKSDVTLITTNGRRYPASREAIAMLYGRVAALGS
jgi:hypothetical protein